MRIIIRNISECELGGSLCFSVEGRRQKRPGRHESFLGSKSMSTEVGLCGILSSGCPATCDIQSPGFCLRSLTPPCGLVCLAGGDALGETRAWEITPDAQRLREGRLQVLFQSQRTEGQEGSAGRDRKLGL